MENFTSIRLELGINAQKFMQQVQIHNASIESEIARGIEMALEEISNRDNFAEAIKSQVIKTVDAIVTESIIGWEMKSKIRKAIEDKMGEQINIYAEGMAKKMIEKLTDKSA